jgi:nucleoside-diphosphate-sugar epimerase
MPKTVLITGASGLVGSEAVRSFAAAGWKVIAVSRRAPEVEGDQVEHLAVDLRDRDAVRAAFASLAQVTHVVYAALFELPGLIEGWRDAEQMAVNEAMLKNTLNPLIGTCPLRHVSLLQGGKAYGVHIHPIPVPARENLPRDDHENFYWLQEDYVRGLAEREGIAYTVLRPQVIFGGNYGVAMNVVPILGAFAALCRREAIPFSFPGGPEFIQEGVDARLVGAALRWAAEAPGARNEIFNITNGDVFHWRGLWPAIAAVMGVEPAPDERRSMVAFMAGRGAAWSELVAAHDLRAISLPELCGESDQYADFLFGYGLEVRPPYGLLSTIKIREAGFDRFYDTEKTVTYWLRDLIERRVLPRPDGQ